MSPCRSLTRRSILQILAGSSLTQMVRADSSANLTLAVEQGFQRLDARYWSPELSIWLDRPGNDLRAWFEGRLNPPWWSCANAVETLVDFMAATGNRRWIAPLAELHRYHRDNPDHVAGIIPALKARGQWSGRDDEARRTYGADLVLIRPDHHIAWRGDASCVPEEVLGRAIEPGDFPGTESDLFHDPKETLE